MSDQSRLEQLIQARHPCISIVTQEEQHALELLRNTVMGSPAPLWMWSVTRGIYPGLLEGERALPDTENPAAALYYFGNKIAAPSICTMPAWTNALRCSWNASVPSRP